MLSSDWETSFAIYRSKKEAVVCPACGNNQWVCTSVALEMREYLCRCEKRVYREDRTEDHEFVIA